jgi:hypothetical protein
VRVFVFDQQFALGEQVRDGIGALSNDLRTSTSIAVNQQSRELTDDSTRPARPPRRPSTARRNSPTSTRAELRDRARRLLHRLAETPRRRRLTLVA